MEGIRHPWTCRAFPGHNRRKAYSFGIPCLPAVRGVIGHWAMAHTWRVVVCNKEAEGVMVSASSIEVTGMKGFMMVG